MVKMTKQLSVFLVWWMYILFKSGDDRWQQDATVVKQTEQFCNGMLKTIWVYYSITPQSITAKNRTEVKSRKCWFSLWLCVFLSVIKNNVWWLGFSKYLVNIVMLNELEVVCHKLQRKTSYNYRKATFRLALSIHTFAKCITIDPGGQVSNMLTWHQGWSLDQGDTWWEIPSHLCLFCIIGPCPQWYTPESWSRW